MLSWALLARRPRRGGDRRWAGWALAVSVLLLVAIPSVSYAAAWAGTVAEIQKHLDVAVVVYARGQTAEGKEAVNAAYFGLYEARGMETAVRLSLSARRAATAEYAFSEIKALMTRGAPVDAVRQATDRLVADLRTDAAALDGSAAASAPALLPSLVIILREGVEAILILAALIAYLVRTGHARQVRTVYQGALLALAASAATAWLLGFLLQAGGAAQEAMEGFTLLGATAVLLLVSYWLVSKVQAGAWQSYIKDRLGESLSRGSRLALWWAAFLAVYREGAETVLFYRALLAGGADPAPVALGLVLGLGLLAVVFAGVRWGSLRIPIRPFFKVTSLLLYYMAVVFAGKGVLELQAAGVVSVTPVALIPTLDWAGVYPTLETAAVQGGLLILTVIAWLVTRRRRAAAAAGAAPAPGPVG